LPFQRKFDILNGISSPTGGGMTDTVSKKGVGRMFDAIAHRYDFLNHFLSFGMDRYWRRFAVRQLGIRATSVILDCATGTCDCAIAAARYSPKKIVGVDISLKMLLLGKEKLQRKSLGTIELVGSGIENLSFRTECFDSVIVAFGVRNFFDLEKGLHQMHRVLKPGGRLVVLEFSKPRHFPFKQLYLFYFRRILPLLGRTISNDKNAYTYLPASVMEFLEGETFIARLSEAGFRTVTSRRLTFGIVTVYAAEK
jgi:demethylmenaquinone methyltransferase/2-methoxy-6-polyprenyl-1,4-benzoquinol methylase